MKTIYKQFNLDPPDPTEPEVICKDYKRKVNSVYRNNVPSRLFPSLFTCKPNVIFLWIYCYVAHSASSQHSGASSKIFPH